MSGRDASQATGGAAERWPLWLARVAGAVLLLMLVVMTVDVVGRKFLDRPLLGAVELVERLLLLSVYAAIPLVSCRHEHIHIELFDNLGPPAWRAWRLLASDAISALLMLGCGLLAFGKAWQAWQAGDSTTLLSIRLWPFEMGVAALLLATALVHVVMALTPKTRGGEAAQP